MDSILCSTLSYFLAEALGTVLSVTNNPFRRFPLTDYSLVVSPVCVPLPRLLPFFFKRWR